MKKFAARCGARVPGWLDEAFDKATRDGREDLLSVALATELCADLIDGGVEDLHFYTLNKPELTQDIARALGRDAARWSCATSPDFAGLRPPTRRPR